MGATGDHWPVDGNTGTTTATITWTTDTSVPNREVDIWHVTEFADAQRVIGNAGDQP